MHILPETKLLGVGILAVGIGITGMIMPMSSVPMEEVVEIVKLFQV